MSYRDTEYDFLKDAEELRLRRAHPGYNEKLNEPFLSRRGRYALGAAVGAILTINIVTVLTMFLR